MTTESGLRLQDNTATVRVWAPGADQVELCLIDEGGHERRDGLAPTSSGHHHGVVDGVAPGQRYGFRVHGPSDPDRGLWHDPTRLLVDPHALAVAGDFVVDASPEDGARPPGLVGVAVEPPAPPRPGPEIALADTVIYETHVRGLTMSHPDVAPKLRGTYRGASSPPIIDHLQRLGVTAVELMPVAQHISEPFLQRRGLRNYWGYSTLLWFAPHNGYATGDDGRQVREFAAMVDEFHANDIEVIVDVVFNHTAEGGRTGPVLSMKGLNNSGWYRLDPADSSTYLDWTGTGNTVATHHSEVREAIVSALHWWAHGLGVDGFRFDLAVTLGRDAVDFHPDHLRWLTDDPRLGGVKLFAEPWDLGPDGYRLGGFGSGWSEWNGRYRDEIRDVWRGAGTRQQLATRLAGSDELYADPRRSVNLITAHDGFTLADLVAYDHKHNEANGENNADGHDDNRSWNSGTEGPTDDPDILDIRHRRAAGMLATLLLSQGVPLVLGGDELGRSQNGNNNAYALDGPTSWYDWSEEPLVNLITTLTRLRRSHRRLLSDTGDVDWRWLEPDGEEVESWQEPGPVTAIVSAGEQSLAMVFNPTNEAVSVSLPGQWITEFDSSKGAATGTVGSPFEVTRWSVVVLRPQADPGGQRPTDRQTT